MNRYFAAHGMILREFGIHKDMKNMRQRCHAVIYLLQEAGINLGYAYTWNYNQPYSKGLAEYLKNNGIENLTNPNYRYYELSDNVQNTIRQIVQLSKSRPSELNLTAWYVLLASTLYIYKRRKLLNLNKGEEPIAKELTEQNSTFTRAQCRYALKMLKSDRLVHQSEVTLTAA